MRGTVVDGYLTLAGLQVVVWEGHAIVLVLATGLTYDLGPGDAMFIPVNGTVYKLQRDGTAFDNLFNVNFPLYGRTWDLDPRPTQSPDTLCVPLSDLSAGRDVWLFADQSRSSMRDPHTVAAIVGALRRVHGDDTARAMNFTLTETERGQIRAAFDDTSAALLAAK